MAISRFLDPGDRRHGDGATAVIQRTGAGGAVAVEWGEVERMERTFRNDLLGRREEGIIPHFSMRSAESLSFVLASLNSGARVALLNPRLRRRQVSDLVAACGATVGVIDGHGCHSLRDQNSEEAAGPLREWILINEHLRQPFHSKAIDALRASYAISEPSTLEQVGESSSDTHALGGGVCLFTSGSTGRPKGVLISARDLIGRAEAEVEWYELGPDDTVLNILPWSFDVGLNQVLSAVVAGSTIVMSESWMPADLLKSVEEFGITGISGVPKIWSDLLRSGLDPSEHDLSSLRYITVSGGGLPTEQLERLQDFFPDVGIIKTYGQTEAFRPTCLLPEHFRDKMASVGRPFGGCSVYITRADGSQAGPMEHGEIVHVGLGTMEGYLGGNDEEKLGPNPFRETGDDPAVAVFTGDQGYIDQDGFLFVLGRRDAMIKLHGVRVYPSEASAQIARSLEMPEATAVPLRRDSETILVAFLACEDAAFDEIALLRRLRRDLPPYLVPSRLFRVGSIPRTTTGKPDIGALVRVAEERFDS